MEWIKESWTTYISYRDPKENPRTTNEWENRVNRKATDNWKSGL